jgi:uncharacterized Zn finger protein
MPREDARTKGMRYLVEGRLLVRSVGPQGIRALCRGGGEFYTLGFESGSWFCTCPALTRCAHMWALMAVCTRPAGIR